MKLKHKIALFVVYFILFLTVLALIDYYAYYIIPGWIVITVSFISALISTLVHAKRKEKTKVDELAEELEEII